MWNEVDAVPSGSKTDDILFLPNIMRFHQCQKGPFCAGIDDISARNTQFYSIDQTLCVQDSIKGQLSH